MTLRNKRAVLSRERVHTPLFVVYVVCHGCGEVMRRVSERRNLKSSASQHVVPLWKPVMISQLEERKQRARSATRAPRVITFQAQLYRNFAAI